MTYCLDSSSLIDASTRNYPIDRFPTFWRNLDKLIADGRAASPDEVLREIEKKDDALHGWCKTKNGLFIPLEEDVQAAVSEILAEFPRLVDDRPSKGQADPFVIAVARKRGLIVVTQEDRNRGKNSKKAKIPDVCDHFGVAHIRLLELIRRENWTF